MNDKLQRISYELRQLGRRGQLGIVLFLAALVLLGMTNAKMNEAEALTLVDGHLETNILASVESSDDIDVVKRFYEVLPDQDGFNQAITEILHTAEDYGFLPDRSDYTESLVLQARMVRYQIKLPLIASYIEVRKFISDVMNAQPTIALHNVSFSRDDINEELVDANIEFVLYTKAYTKTASNKRKRE